jgi:hypothetical protein
MSKITKRVVIPKSEATIKKEQRQAKLVELADKKAKDKLTLEDIDAKLDIVLELLGQAAGR